MIYLVVAIRPSPVGNRIGEVHRFECMGVLATVAISSDYREKGYAVTVLKPLPVAAPS